MKQLLIKFYSAQIMAALRLGTFGEWWAARAAHRLGKLSGEPSGEEGRP